MVEACLPVASSSLGPNIDLGVGLRQDADSQSSFIISLNITQESKSVTSSCLDFVPGEERVILHPRTDYFPSATGQPVILYFLSCTS